MRQPPRFTVATATPTIRNIRQRHVHRWHQIYAAQRGTQRPMARGDMSNSEYRSGWMRTDDAWLLAVLQEVGLIRCGGFTRRPFRSRGRYRPFPRPALWWPVGLPRRVSVLLPSAGTRRDVVRPTTPPRVHRMLRELLGHELVRGTFAHRCVIELSVCLDADIRESTLAAVLCSSALEGYVREYCRSRCRPVDRLRLAGAAVGWLITEPMADLDVRQFATRVTAFVDRAAAVETFLADRVFSKEEEEQLDALIVDLSRGRRQVWHPRAVEPPRYPGGGTPTAFETELRRMLKGSDQD